MRYPAIMAAAALLGASVTAPALAADESKGRVEVSYSDLDLDTEAGRAELTKRFEDAARSNCGVRADGSGNSFARDCYKRATRLIGQQVAAAADRQASGG